jgi:hypothetical protein
MRASQTSLSSPAHRERNKLDVSDVLRDRMAPPPGLERMVAMSVLAHGVLLAAIILAPGGLFGGASTEPKTVMTISLGSGTPGPLNGGMTAMGGRAVQEATPPTPKAPEPVRPPAAKAEMVLPKGPPIKNANAADVKQAPDQARGRTPSKGAETTKGSALVDTGIRGQGFGLSSGGGKGSGSTLDVDFGTFCCPDWLDQVLTQIRTNWDDKSDVAGHVLVKFTIQRNGMLTDSRVDKESPPYPPNSTAARRAVAYTKQVVPLPAAFPNPTLTVDLDFEYTR